MKTVNYRYLSSLLTGLAGGADDDEICERYKNVDVGEEQTAKAIIKEWLLPYHQILPESYKEAEKFSVSYFLTTDKIDYERLLDSNVLPFGNPVDCKQFFIWIWEVYFPNESYIMKNLEGIIQKDDGEELDKHFLKI